MGVIPGLGPREGFYCFIVIKFKDERDSNMFYIAGGKNKRLWVGEGSKGEAGGVSSPHLNVGGEGT